MNFKDTRVQAAGIVVAALLAGGLAFALWPTGDDVQPSVPSAVGIQTADAGQLNTVNFLLATGGIETVLIDEKTVGVRPDDAEAAKKILTDQDQYSFVYSIVPTSVQQPDERPAPTPSSSASASASPSASPSPSGSPSASPSGSAILPPEITSDPYATAEPPTPSWTPPPFVEVAPLPKMDPIESDPKAAALASLDFADSAWAPSSSVTNSFRTLYVLRFANLEAAEKMEQWRRAAAEAGSSDVASVFAPSADPLVYTSFGVVPEPIVSAIKNYVGPENVTSVQSETIVGFIVTTRMSESRAESLVKTLPLPMTVGPIPGGEVMFTYVGPVPSVSQFERLGEAFRKATGSPVVAVPF